MIFGKEEAEKINPLIFHLISYRSTKLKQFHVSLYFLVSTKPIFQTHSNDLLSNSLVHPDGFILCN